MEPAFVEELCAFPNGAHDDQVDAASAAFRALVRRRRMFLVGADQPTSVAGHTEVNASTAASVRRFARSGPQRPAHIAAK